MRGCTGVRGRREPWGDLRPGGCWGGSDSGSVPPGLAGHVAAVLASLLALLALLLVVLLYVKCRLNVLLWYQDKYGEVEMNGAWGPDVGEGGLPRLSL